MKRMMSIVCCVFLAGCPTAQEPDGGEDRQDCQSNCASCLTGTVRAECDDACLDLTEAAAKSFNRCADLSDCGGVPDCASTHLQIDTSGVDTSNVPNNANNVGTNNGTTSPNNDTNNRPCLGQCIDNSDCDSSARCEVQSGPDDSCCKRGTRGTRPIGDMCETENECTSGFCEMGGCTQYCEFTADCDPQFVCEGMRCIPGEMICDDFQDNDLNGATDCQDEACDGQPCDPMGGLCSFMDQACL